MIDVLRGEGAHLAEIKVLCTALDDPEAPIGHVLGIAQTLAVGAPRPDASGRPSDLMARQDWPAVRTDAARMVESGPYRSSLSVSTFPTRCSTGTRGPPSRSQPSSSPGSGRRRRTAEMVAGWCRGSGANRLLVALVALACVPGLRSLPLT